MGPRFLGRGNITLANPAGIGSIASMGPRFLGRGNYARICLSGQSLWGASMGPRFLGRGNNLLIAGASIDQNLASMGPRFLGRGNNEDDAGFWTRLFASMGPRFLGRGNHLLWKMDQPPEICFNGAALFRARKFD